VTFVTFLLSLFKAFLPFFPFSLSSGLGFLPFISFRFRFFPRLLSCILLYVSVIDLFPYNGSKLSLLCRSCDIRAPSFIKISMPKKLQSICYCLRFQGLKFEEGNRITAWFVINMRLCVTLPVVGF
jgi:hypothetical protein